MKRLLLLILCLSSLSVITARAQQQDDEGKPKPADTSRSRPDSSHAYFFYNNFDQYGRVNIKHVDTAIDNTTDYNAVYRNNRLQQTLGNTGSASQCMVAYPLTRNAGFDYGIHTYDPWLFQNDSVRYYKVLKTYTDIHYVQGSKKEIFFDATFSRNIIKSFNLGFNFRVLSSTGAYQRQKTNIVNFVLTAQYFTPDHRYAIIANLLLNRIKNQENGGITYDSLFTQNIETNRFVIPVNLASAQNRVKESGFYMKNYFTIASSDKKKSDTTKNNPRKFNLGRIVYSFQYNKQIQNYLDEAPGSGFYDTSFYNPTATEDSMTIKKLVNELGWTNPTLRADKQFKVLQLDFRLRYQYIEVSDLEGKNYLSQWIPYGAVSFQPYYGLRIEGNASYVSGDYNGGDFLVRADLGIVPGKKGGKAGMIHFAGTYALQEPSWFLHRYNSNHFKWENDFEKLGIISGGAWYDREYLTAGLSLSRINHFAYLDETAHPAQLNDQIGYFVAMVRGKLPVWRFAFNAQLAYQNVQGTNALQLPAFAGNLAVTYTQPLFKGAATLEPGLNFFYNTAYYGNAYMPDSRSFYLQYEQKTGNYIYMDVFVNVKIQRARLFVMYSHFNAGLMGHDYFTTPGYPMPDGSFRFGVTWRFHD